INTDGIFDDYIFYFAKKNLYTSFIGEKYNTGIGISVKTDIDSRIKSMFKVLEYKEVAFNSKLNKKDIAFLKVEKVHFELNYKFSFILWFKFSILTFINPKCFIDKDHYFKFLLDILKIPAKKVYYAFKRFFKITIIN
ncbi:MAG: hypothetical protein HGB12_15495, partial [Bacteroidetes bacterium]|nr:hypothetical protein [Bacteroidota bacterium]